MMIVENQAAIDWVMETYFFDAGSRGGNGSNGSAFHSEEALVDKIKASKGGEKFSLLWAGDFSAYPSQSEADIALCQILAFWTGKDAAAMDRLFRQSGLYRPKWDQRNAGSTYGERTIRKAIERTHETYSPGSTGGERTRSEARSSREEKVREPDPLPNELSPVEPFDFALLPSSLAPWAEDICTRMQCPPDYVAVGIMVGLGSLIGRRVGIRPMEYDDWTETPNLWGMVVGRPGVLKSPSVEQTLIPLKRLVADAQASHEQAMKEYTRLVAEYQYRKNALDSEAKKRLKGNHMADLSDILSLEAPVPPVLRRYVSSDSTPEALGELLRQNPEGVLVYRDEVVSLLKGLDREDRVEARGFYLTGWNGNSAYTFDRIGRGLNLHVGAVCLSLLGGTQPGRLSEYIRHAVRGGSADDGLIQRFGLLVWPDTSPDWVNVDRLPNTGAKNQAFEIYKYLSELTPETIDAQQDSYGDAPDGIPYLRLSPVAQEMFRDWRGKLEAKLRGGELHPALESHFSKYRKLIPTLALIGHLADMGTGPVGEDATLRALAWGQYLESHARRAYGSAVQPEVAVAKAILSRIRKGDLKSPFTPRDIQRSGWSMLTDSEQVTGALVLLEDYGWLTTEKRTDTGGRPSLTYTAHEGVWR